MVPQAVISLPCVANKINPFHVIENNKKKIIVNHRYLTAPRAWLSILFSGPSRSLIYSPTERLREDF